MAEHLRTPASDGPATPLISTVARGGRMTRVAPGGRVGRVDGRMLAYLAASCGAWAAAGQQWLRDQPQFTIEVSYASHDGPRRLEAQLLTDASQVPVVGSPMVVRTDGRGTTHVDLDHEAGITYLDDHARYEAARD